MRFVFLLCKDLKIDDPVTWMNAVPAKTVDWWMAYYTVEADAKSGKNMQSPEAQGKALAARMA